MTLTFNNHILPTGTTEYMGLSHVWLLYNFRTLDISTNISNEDCMVCFHEIPFITTIFSVELDLQVAIFNDVNDLQHKVYKF